ncbi:MAG: peroxiredoxin family protein [Aquificaceae bacterium]
MKRTILVVLIFLISSCQNTSSLPDITVRNMKGEKVKLTQYKGKETIIYVWSRTCAGHTKDLKNLNTLTQKYPSYNIISYAIAMDVKDVMVGYRDLAIKPIFETLVDTSAEFNNYFPITFLPSTYVFDKDGKLLASYAGLPESF